MPEPFGGLAAGVGVFGIVFATVFVLIVGTFIFMIAKGLATWSSNNAQPVLTVPARIVTKRTQTSGMGATGDMGGSVSTWYYVTFEMGSGERRELGVSGHEYGLLAEGDEGTLTYQGTRYKGFARAAGL